jgi:V/A-type H+-transporting ATPase subunit B
MIQLFADYRSTLEKLAMGFRMSDWDKKLIKYGRRFEKELMDLSVNIPLEKALDLGWDILADCFEPMETGIHSSLIEQFWPKEAAASTKAGDPREDGTGEAEQEQTEDEDQRAEDRGRKTDSEDEDEDSEEDTEDSDDEDEERTEDRGQKTDSDDDQEEENDKKDQ